MLPTGITLAIVVVMADVMRVAMAKDRIVAIAHALPLRCTGQRLARA